MKTEKNILFAFILNISFSIFELIGGFFTNSIAILSDSIHDLGDALSIGVSYILEKKSKKKPDNNYTYGYVRYSVLGGFITTSIFLLSSIVVIYNAIHRLLNPVIINYKSMIIFAIIGVILNFIAAYLTKDGDSINQKSVNLHMLEDVLGWITVLIGAIIMNYTNIKIIDSIISIGVSIFIIIHAIKNLRMILDLFLEKTPNNIDIEKIRNELLTIDEIKDIHHIHIWSIDGYNNFATMHIVTKTNNIIKIKENIRDILKKYNIYHSILETEDEKCLDTECNLDLNNNNHHKH